VGAWAVIQVAATVFPLLGLAEWAARVVVVLALLGFPMAVVLAWFFDVTARGVVRTPDAADALASGSAPVPPPAAATRGGRAAGMFGLGMLVALVTVAAYFSFGPERPSARAESIDSIAVLPFADMSAAHDQEYFSDGIAEELIDRLAEVEGLRVAARTSSFAFKNTKEDVTEIGRRLRVKSVLEGSVRREGDRLRVTAQLVDARNGYNLWNESFDREASSVFAIQDEIANSIVEALRKEFVVEEATPSRHATSLRAHDTYLQALARLNYRTDANVRQAITLFEQVIREDSMFAPAWAGLAQAYAVLPSLGDFPMQDAISSGTTAAARALEVDAKLADAHAALGQIAQNFRWDLNSAERAYRRALLFNKDYAPAHQWYAEALMMLGHLDQAQQEADTAWLLDPLSPSARTVRAYILAVRQQYQPALEEYRSVTSLYPEFTIAQVNKALLAVYLRSPEDAVAAASFAARGDTAAAAAIRTIAAAAADTTRRSQAIALLPAVDRAFPPATAALWYVALGQGEEALQRLERAVEERTDPNVPFILWHPLLVPLRQDARFRALAESIGLGLD
jgi:serine/threonine-protein kinase